MAISAAALWQKRSRRTGNTLLYAKALAAAVETKWQGVKASVGGWGQSMTQHSRHRLLGQQKHLPGRADAMN